MSELSFCIKGIQLNFIAMLEKKSNKKEFQYIFA